MNNFSLYNNHDPYAYSFMAGGRFDWFEGGFAEFKTKTGIDDFGKYQEARFTGYNQEIEAAKGIVDHNLGNVVSAMNKRYLVNNAIQDFENTMSIAQGISNLGHVGSEGRIFAFDTETLGFSGTKMNPDYGMVTEIGFANVRYKDGYKISNADTVKRTAVFGIDEKQEKALRDLFNKSKSQGLESLTGTERSTIERVTKYRGMDQGLSVWDAGNNTKVLMINKGEPKALPHSEEAFEEGLASLRNIYNMYNGDQQKAFDAVKGIIQDTINTTDPNTFTVAKNKKFDITALDLGNETMSKVFDVQTPLEIIAANVGVSKNVILADTAGGTMKTSGAGLTAYAEAFNTTDITTFADEFAHIAGEDSFETASVLMKRINGGVFNNKTLLDTAFDAFDYTKENTNIIQNLNDKQIYIKRQGNNRKTDILTRTVDGSETAFSGLNPANQFWHIDESRSGVMTNPAIVQDGKTVREASTGVMLSFVNSEDESVRLYKYFTGETLEDAYSSAGSFLAYSTDIIENSNVTPEQIHEQANLAYQDSARRRIERFLRPADAGTNGSKELVNGEADLERYSKITSEIKALGKDIDFSDKNWATTEGVAEVFSNNGINIDRYGDVRETGYVMEYLDSLSCLTRDIESAMPKDITNFERTSILETTISSLSERIAKQGYVKATPDIPIALQDMLSVTFEGVNGELHDVNFGNDINNIAGNIAHIYKGNTPGETISNMLNAGNNLVERGLLTPEDLSDLTTRYSLNDSDTAVAQDIAATIKSRISFINDMDLSVYGRTHKDAISIKEGLYGFSDIGNQILSEEQYNILANKNIRPIYSNTLGSLSTSYVDQNGTAKTFAEVYSQIRDSVVSDINNAIENRANYISGKGFKFGDTLGKPLSVIIQNGDQTIAGQAPGTSKVLRTYGDLFNYLGYDVSTDSEGNAVTDIGKFIENTIGEKANKSYSLSNKKDIRFGVTGNERGAYIFMTNQSNVANVNAALKDVGENFTESELRSALKDKAAIIAFPKIKNRIAGSIESGTTSKEVADLIGNGENVLLQSLATDSGFETFMSKGLNAYVDNNGKIVASIESMQDQAVYSFRRGGKFALESVESGDFSKAQRQIDRYKNAVKQMAPMSNSFIYDTETGMKYVQPSLRDVARGYEFRLGNTEDMSGIMSVMQEMAWGNNLITKKEVEGKIVKIKDPLYNPNYNPEVAKMFGLFNASARIGESKPIVSDKLSENFNAAKVENFTKKDIERIMKSEVFKEFYAKSLYTNGVDTGIDGVKSSIYGYGTQPIIKNASGKFTSIDVQRAMEVHGVKDLSELEHTSILGVINTAIQSGDYDDNTKKTFSRLWNARNDISMVMPISSMAKGNIMFINLPDLAQVGTESSSIRPTALSMFDAYRYSMPDFMQEVNKDFGSRGFERTGIMASSGIKTKLASNFETIMSSQNGYITQFKDRAGKIVKTIDHGEQYSTMNMFYKAMDQAQINAVTDSDNMNIARKIALRSFSDRTGISITDINKNADYKEAIDTLIKDTVAMAQVNEGKFIVAPEIASNSFFNRPEAEKVSINGLKRLIETGSEEDINTTSEILNSLVGRKVSNGDIIAKNGKTKIRYSGPDATFSQEVVDSLLTRGEALIAGDMTAVGAAKLNIAQEKNTTIGINIHDYARRNDGPFMNLTDEELAAAASSAWDALVGYDVKNPNAVRSMAIMPNNFIKHNLALPLESQMHLISRAYNGNGQELLKELAGSDKYQHAIKDLNLGINSKGEITYDMRGNGSGMAHTVRELMQGFESGEIGRFESNGRSASDFITDTYNYMLENRIGIADVSRVNMRQATAEKFTWDPRMEQALRRQAYNDSEWVNSDRLLSDSIYSEFTDLQRQYVQDGTFNKQFGAGLKVYNGDISKTARAKYYTSHSPYNFEENKKLIEQMKRSFEFFENPNNEAFKGNLEILRLDAAEILDRIPESGADATAYNQFITRIDHKLPDYLQRRLTEGMDPNNIHSFVMALDNPIEVNGKRYEEIMMPIFNISSNPDDSLYKTKMISKQTSLLNDLKEYRNMVPGERYKDKGNMLGSEWIASRIEDYYNSLALELKPNDKESLISKLGIRYQAPNGSESLAAQDVAPTVKNSVAPKINELESALMKGEYSKEQINELYGLYNQLAQESDDIIKKISEGNMKDVYKSLNISENKFKERFGKYVMIGRDGEIQNSVEVGLKVFDKAGLDIHEVSKQLIEEAEANGGNLVNFENESRFGGIFAFGKTVGEVGKSKTNIGSVESYLNKWETNVVNSIKQQAGYVTSDEAANELIGIANKFEESILAARNEGRSVFAATENGINKAFSELEKINTLTHAERVMIQNSIEQSSRDAIDSAAKQYFKHVGILGFTTRYPIFSQGSTMMSRIYLGEDLANEIRYFGPQYPKLLHVDFDADDVFTQFISNVTLYNEHDKYYSLAKEIYNSRLGLNKEALIDYFKNADYRISTNPASVNALMMSRVEDLISNGHKDIEEAYNTSIDKFKTRMADKLSDIDLESDSGKKMFKFLFSYSTEGVNLMDKYDINVLHTVDNIIASAKAEATKGQIGYISNPGRDINNVIARLLDDPNQDIRKLKKIATNLDYVGTFNGKFGPIGALNITEQTGIDVKKIFEGEEYSKSSEFKIVINALMDSRNPMSSKNTPISPETMDTRTQNAIEGLVKVTKSSLFAGDENYNIKQYSEEIFNGSMEKFEQELANAIESKDKSAIIAANAKLQIRALTDAAYNDKARELYFNDIMTTGSTYDKKLVSALNEAYNTAEITGSDVISIATSMVSNWQPDENLIISKDVAYGLKTSADNPFARLYNISEFYEDNNNYTLRLAELNGKGSITLNGKSKREINEQIADLFAIDNSSAILPLNDLKDDVYGTLVQERRTGIAQDYTTQMVVNAAMSGKDITKINKKADKYVKREIEAILGSDIKTEQEYITSQLNAIEMINMDGGDVSSKELLRSINQNMTGRRKIPVRNVINDYVTSKGIDINDFNRYVDNNIGNNMYLNIANAAETASQGFTSTIPQREALKAGQEHIETIIGTITEDEQRKIYKDILQRTSDSIESEIKTTTANNAKSSYEAFEILARKMIEEGATKQDLSKAFGWENIFKDGKLVSDIDFNKISIGYGPLMNRKYGSIKTKEELDILRETFSSDIINDEEIFTKGKQIAERYLNSGIDKSIKAAETATASVETKAINNAFETVEQVINNAETVNNIDKEIAEEAAKATKDAARKTFDGERKTITGSILKSIKGIPNIDKKIIKGGAVALGLLAVPSIIGHIAHSAKTGDALVPHSTKMDGKNPYTGDPEYTGTEASEELESRDAQGVQRSRQTQEQAPQSGPGFTRNVYVDPNTGLSFKVNARTKALLDYRQAGGTARALGIDSGSFTTYNDSSSINDNWLQSKFAETLL